MNFVFEFFFATQAFCIHAIFSGNVCTLCICLYVLCHIYICDEDDSSSIEIEGYSDGKSLRLLKLVFFTYKGAGILQTSLYITQRVLATPTLIGT